MKNCITRNIPDNDKETLVDAVVATENLMRIYISILEGWLLLMASKEDNIKYRSTNKGLGYRKLIDLLTYVGDHTGRLA